MQQQETGKQMYNGDNIFTSQRQEVYSSNTSVSDALDENKIQNNKDFVVTNPCFNKKWRSEIEYCIGTCTKETSMIWFLLMIEKLQQYIQDYKKVLQEKLLNILSKMNLKQFQITKVFIKKNPTISTSITRKTKQKIYLNISIWSLSFYDVVGSTVIPSTR